MQVVYTFCTRADGTTHEQRCEGLWQALTLAGSHLEHQASEIEPVSITTSLDHFDRGRVMAMLFAWNTLRWRRPE